MSDRIQAALEARKARISSGKPYLEEKPETSQEKIDLALKARENRITSNLQSTFSDLEKGINLEIEAFKKLSNPSWGGGNNSLITSLEVTRQNRINVDNLIRKVEAHRKYLGDEKTQAMLKPLNEMRDGYNIYSNVAEIRSKYNSEEEYENKIKAAEQTQTDYNAMTTFNLDEGFAEIEGLLNGEEINALKIKQAEIKEQINKLGNHTKGVGFQKKQKLQKELNEVNVRIKKIENQASQKKVYWNQAKHIQDGLKLHNDAINAEDFGNYNVSNSDFADDRTYKYINDINGFRASEDSYWMKHNTYTTEQGLVFPAIKPAYIEANYEYMNEEEIGIFNYYYSKFGKTKAYEYLNNLEQTLNTRSAVKIREQNDTDLERMLFGVTAGLDQFSSGMKNLFNSKDEYITPSDTQIASGMIREDLGDSDFKILGSTIGQMGYDLINNTSNMLPSIMTSTVVGWINPAAGAVVGAGLMGASASGNAYAEMLNLGYDKGQARLYSGLVGASEATLQYLLGGIGKLGGGKLTTEALVGIANNLDNAFARVAIKLGASAVGEFTEEYLQEILDPFFKNLALGTEEDLKLFTVDALYSGILGALSAGLFEGGGTISSEIRTAKQNKKYSGLDSGSIQALVNEGLESSIGSDSRILAENLQNKINNGQKITGREIAALVFKNENQILSDDTTKINNAVKNRLSELGETADIDTVSKAITKQVSGEQLTKAEQMAINNSRFGQRVLNEATTDNIKSGDYSSSWAENIGTDRINSDAYNLGVQDIDAAGNNGYNETVENANVGGNINGSQNTELLARGQVSAVGGSGNSLREQSPNTAIICGELGTLSGNQGTVDRRLAAGTSAWVSSSNRQPAREVGGGLEENFLRGIRGVALQNTDTIGRTLSPELQEELKDSVFRTEDGKIISFFHWTPNSFEVFKYGDGAYHVGTLQAAISIKNRPQNKQQGNIKEVYINSKNPLVVYDDGSFSPSVITGQLVEYGLMSVEMRKELRQMEGFYSKDINSEACQYMLKYIEELGFDSYFYKNKHEDTGVWSVGVFRSEQIITVAENGVLKENIGVKEADSHESASLMPENSDLQLTAVGKISTLSAANPEYNPIEDLHYKSVGVERLTADQKKLKKVGQQFGAKVLFKDLDEIRIDQKSGKEFLFSPEGQFDPEANTITLNTNVKDYHRPLEYILKHELTHSLEIDENNYALFATQVLRSEAFIEYVRSKGFESADAWAADIIKQYSSKGVKGYQGPKAQLLANQEMVANFVGDMLFGGRTDITEKLLSSMTPTQRNGFIAKIKEFFAKLKQFFKGTAELTEIERLENLFLETANKVAEKNKSATEGSGDIVYSEGNIRKRDKQYSFAVEKDTSLVEEAEQLERELKAENKTEDEIREAIWKEHHIIRDPEGVWKYEIDDSDMEVYPNGDLFIKDDPDYKEYMTLKYMTEWTEEQADRFAELDDKFLLEYGFGEPLLKNYVKHDKLFAKYPQLKEAKIDFDELGPRERGYYDRANNRIVLDERFKMLDKTGMNIDAIHEIQHVMQKIDDTEPGASEEYWNARLLRGDRLPINPATGKQYTPYEAYMRTRGEIEARESASRVDMTDEQRRETVPNLGWENSLSAREPVLTSEYDAEYSSAVENSNLTKAQQMVDAEIANISKGKEDLINGKKGLILPEPDISKDMRSEAERISEIVGGKANAKYVARQEVRELGKELGWKVLYGDVYAKDANGNLIYIKDQDGNLVPKRAEAKVDKSNKTITIDYQNKYPIKTIVKHELTHFLELNSKTYSSFAKKVFSSEVFEQWLSQEGVSDIDEYRDSIISQYIGSKGFETIEAAEISADFEIVARFVADNLFNNDGQMMQRIAEMMNPTQRSKFYEFICSIFEKLKEFFKGKDGYSEVVALEREWVKAYRAANSVWENEFGDKIGRSTYSALETHFINKFISKLNEMKADSGESAFSMSFDEEYFIAKQRDISVIDKAEVMEKRLANKGLSDFDIACEVWLKYGVVRDDKGEWVYEINDWDLHMDKYGRMRGNKGKKDLMLPDYIDLPRLYEKYPQLNDIEVIFKSNLEKKEKTPGYYDPDTNSIVLDKALLDNANKLEGVFIHEIQHAIQKIDGRESGSSEAFWRLYNDLFGHDEMPTNRDTSKKNFEKTKKKYNELTRSLPEPVVTAVKEYRKAKEEGDEEREFEIYKEAYQSEFRKMFDEYDFWYYKYHRLMEDGVNVLSPEEAVMQSAGEREAQMVEQRYWDVQDKALDLLLQLAAHGEKLELKDIQDFMASYVRGVPVYRSDLAILENDYKEKLFAELEKEKIEEQNKTEERVLVAMGNRNDYSGVEKSKKEKYNKGEEKEAKLKSNKFTTDESKEKVTTNDEALEALLDGLGVDNKKDNYRVRLWYIDKVSQIHKSINQQLPIEVKARQAFELRNKIRLKARSMMQDDNTRALLEKERPNKTFEELVEAKMKRKQMSKDEAVADIYNTATKTNKEVNDKIGLEGD